MIATLYNWYYRRFPPPMVSWWQTKEAVQAKVTTDKYGAYIMWMEGEKYPFPGYPRGHLLWGTLSPLKHAIKTLFFNENWWRLERGEALLIHEPLQKIYALAEQSHYDMIPVRKMCVAMRELHKSLTHHVWRDILTYILQEDDGYRFRFQWLMDFIDKKDPIGSFDKGMEMLEHAEVIDDMKERVRLFRRILMELWKDPVYAKYWTDFVQNADLKKLRLSKADKYFFRAKYFKVDYPKYEY